MQTFYKMFMMMTLPGVLLVVLVVDCLEGKLAAPAYDDAEGVRVDVGGAALASWIIRWIITFILLPIVAASTSSSSDAGRDDDGVDSRAHYSFFVN